MFHVHEMEKFNWKALQYFMFTKWKRLTGELDDISCPRSGKGELENWTIFPIHEVEKFNWRDIQYFMPTKWKSGSGELNNISCARSGKV